MLNTKDYDQFSPRGTPISDDEFSVDYSVGIPPSEPTGDLNGSPNFSDKYVPPPPAPASNIALEGVTPPKISSLVDTTQEGDVTPRKRQPYQIKKSPKDVWERDSDNKLNKVQLNKLNHELYDLTFGTQKVPPMDQKISRNSMRFNFKQ